MKLAVGFDFDLAPFEEEGLRAFLCCMSGSGKSYAAKILCEELSPAGYPIIIIDPEGEYASFRELFQTIIIGGNYADAPLNETIVEQTVDLVLTTQEPLIAVFDLSLLLQTNRSYLAAFVQETLFQLSSKYRRPMFFIVEECQLIAPQTPSKGQSTKPRDMAIDLAKRGRKRGIHSLWISQRPASVDKEVISQCNVHFIGKLVDKRDHAQMKDFLARAEIDVKQLMNLVKTFYLFAGQQTRKVQFRKLKVKDLARTPVVGETVKLARTKDRSLDKIIKDLVKLAKEEQRKQEERQDELKKLQEQNKRLQARVQEQKQELTQLERELKFAKTLEVKMVSGDESIELQQVLEQNRAFEKDNRLLKQQLAEIQEQYNLLAAEIEDRQMVSRFKEKLEQKLTEVLDVIQSFDVSITAAALAAPAIKEQQEQKVPVEPLSPNDRIQFIRHPAIKKELQEVASSPGVSSKAVKGIIAILAQKGAITYEQVRIALGYADKSQVSKAGSRLADRKIILQEKTNSGEFLIRLNIDGLREVIELQEARKNGEAAISEIFGKEG